MNKRLRTWFMAIAALLLVFAVAGSVLAEEAGAETAAAANVFQQSFWSLVPAIIAIGLALITKEVYSSLFIGILTGGLLYSNFNFEGTLI
ncbi:MAG: Na+/H+ antiporter NhaC family protein, partial [Clostridia bacterium]|nr:Na+/H+ antiporter NhaC family protein [Clostridia bacterium]